MSATGLSAETLGKLIDQAKQDERDRCAAIVNEARFEGSVDLRSIVARIRDENYKVEGRK